IHDFFFSSRRRHTRFSRDWSSDVCSSDLISLFAVQGPKATEALQLLTPVELGKLKFYHFTQGEFAGVQDVIISATGYTGAGGYELFVRNEDALTVWNAIMSAGKEFDIKPIDRKSVV